MGQCYKRRAVLPDITFYARNAVYFTQALRCVLSEVPR
jgi:hypothetical protein